MHNSLLDIRNQLVKETCKVLEKRNSTVGRSPPPAATTTFDIAEELESVSKKLSDFDTPLLALDDQMTAIGRQGEKIREEIKFQAELALGVVRQAERNLLEQVNLVVKQKVELLQCQKMEAKLAIQVLQKAEKTLSDRREDPQLAAVTIKTIHSCRGIDPSSFFPIEKPDVKFEGELHQQIGQLKFSQYSKPVLKKTHLYVNRNSVTTLFVKSHDGKPFSIQASLITCQLVNADQNSVVACSVKEINPGKYAITCKPTSMGKHHMIVRLGGIQITENTFTVSVTKAPDDRGTFIKELPLHAPFGIAMKRNGDVTVCEYGSHRLTTLNKSTVAISSIKKILQHAEDENFHCPCGIAISADGRHIFVTDQHRLLKLSSSGVLVGLVGSKHKGNDPLQFQYPHGIAIHPVTGQVYVADTDNGRIQVLNQDLTFSHMFGSEDQALKSPSGLAFDSDLNLYIADCGLHCILKVTGSTVARISFYGADPGQLNRPRSLAIDSNNYIYIAEEGNQRISIFDTKGTFKHCFGGAGGIADSVEFNQPMCVAVDSIGYLYVSDFYNNRLVVLS